MMKKYLPCSAALALVFAASPALAQEGQGLGLHLNGYFAGYVNATDEGDNRRSVDILRATEVHFNGEMTLDNGMTVGTHIEARADQGDSFSIDESYVYFSGNYGKVNFGTEDGAVFLLQVAAPSADSNVDGIRQILRPVAHDVQLVSDDASLDYDNDFTGNDDKITYLTPVFSGFQAGVSYTPQASNAGSRSLNGVSTTNDPNQFGNAWEAALRYEGKFDSVGLKLGAGYTHAQLEDHTLSGFDDDFKEWNVGAALQIGDLGLGAVYTTHNMAIKDSDGSHTYVLGADYKLGSYKLGASFFSQDQNNNYDTDRYTVGGVYDMGSGISFRGSLAYTNVDDDVTGDDDKGMTTLTVGTMINF